MTTSTEPRDGPLGARALKAMAWALASFGSNKVVAFVGTLVLARVLTPAEFGLAAAAIALLAYLEMVLDLGVGSAVVYEQERGITERVHTAFTMNLGLGVLLALLVVAVAPLAASFFQAAGAVDLFRFLGIFVLVRAAAQVPDAVLRRDLDFRRRWAVDVSRAVVRVGIAIPLALAGYGAWSIIIGMTAGEVVATAITWIAARFRPRLRFDRRIVRGLLGYSTTMLGVRFASELANNGDYLIVGNRLGTDLLGIYSIAYRVPELLLVTVFWLYSMVAFPVYAQAHRSGSTGELRRALLRSMRLTTLFAFPAGVGMAIVAHDAVHVLFTDRWAAAVLPMTLLSLALAIDAVQVASGDVLPAVGRPGLLLACNVAVGVPVLVAMVVVAPHGLVAVAWVVLLGSLAFVPLLQGAVNRQLGLRWREIGGALVPASAAAAGVAATALPVRLLLEAGPHRLVATIAAGVVGGAAGIAAGGAGVVPEVRELIRRTRGA